MKLPPEGARWLVSLRWLACAAVVGVTWLTSSMLHVVADPRPLYVIAAVMIGYNLLFYWAQRRTSAGEGNVERNIFLQVLLDLVSLTLLLYFSDLPRNPFLFYFIFHMIIAGMYLRGRAPYFFAGLSTGMVGGVMLFLYLQWIPSHPLHFPTDPLPAPSARRTGHAGRVRGLRQRLWMATYFTTSIRRYVDRAHAEIRQKEKMLGIGQLVAGIAHQIANPLDGVQNCLRRIGERVKDDAHLTEYVQMMGEALDRIERTAKRVQAFARPRGVTLQQHRRQPGGRGHARGAGGRPRAEHPHPEGVGPRGPGRGRSLHLAGSALQPLHQRPERHAPRRHAHACGPTAWAARTRTRWARWRST